MSKLLKKILKFVKKNNSTTKSNSDKAQKNTKNNEAREKCVASVMEKTGWNRNHAVSQITEARKACGISYRDYDRYDFFKVPAEERVQKYQKIIEQKERRKVRRHQKEENAIAGVMQATGWDYDYTREKILEAQKRTGCTFKEYKIYKFYELTEEEQDKVFVAKLSRKITAKYDVNKEFADMLYDKEGTNNYFSEYLKRPWCSNTKISEEEFREKFRNSRRIVYKPLDGNRGRGVEAFDINSENWKEIYNKLRTYPDGVVEQYVVQHPKMSEMAPSSVNTLRIVTVSSNTQSVMSDGRHMDVAYISLRIGGGSSIVDNFHSGGMVAAVDIETGELVTDAADMEGNVFSSHPVTGTVVKGFKIPFFKEAVEMVKDAITTKQVEGYLGWDVAITEDGPVLIEVNVIPGVVLLSMPYVAEKKGMKYVMEKYL